MRVKTSASSGSRIFNRAGKSSARRHQGGNSGINDGGVRQRIPVADKFEISLKAWSHDTAFLAMSANEYQNLSEGIHLSYLLYTNAIGFTAPVFCVWALFFPSAACPPATAQLSMGAAPSHKLDHADNFQ